VRLSHGAVPVNTGIHRLESATFLSCCHHQRAANGTESSTSRLPIQGSGLFVVRWGQLLATLGTSSLEDQLARLGLHSHAKPMRLGASPVIWLECPLHPPVTSQTPYLRKFMILGLKAFACQVNLR
jgi:hypothetical protein